MTTPQIKTREEVVELLAVSLWYRNKDYTGLNKCRQLAELSIIKIECEAVERCKQEQIKAERNYGS